MPIIGFICPDGEKVHKDACFHGCRMGQWCVTQPTLEHMSRNRPWIGKPSTTECIRGTREAFLIRTKDYYIDPQKRAFALHGTLHHSPLERAADAILDVLAEERFADIKDEVTGIADLLIPVQGEPDLYDVVDYKTWGSYPVSLALGKYQIEVETGEFFKSGPRKGLAKTRKETLVDPTKADFGDAYPQLNRYRLFFEDIGFKIRKMWAQATVRDGGTYMAFNRGVPLNIYVFEIPRMPDDVCRGYFKTKAAALVEAMTNKALPPPCDKDENWNGKKCEKFCDVWEFCPMGKAAHAEAQRKADEKEDK